MTSSHPTLPPPRNVTTKQSISDPVQKPHSMLGAFETGLRVSSEPNDSHERRKHRYKLESDDPLLNEQRRKNDLEMLTNLELWERRKRGDVPHEEVPSPTPNSNRNAFTPESRKRKSPPQRPTHSSPPPTQHSTTSSGGLFITLGSHRHDTTSQDSFTQGSPTTSTGSRTPTQFSPPAALLYSNRVTTPLTPTRAHALYSLWERESQERFTRQKLRTSPSLPYTPRGNQLNQSSSSMLSSFYAQSPVRNTATSTGMRLSPTTAAASDHDSNTLSDADMVIGLSQWSPKRKADSPKVMLESPLIRNKSVYTSNGIAANSSSSRSSSVAFSEGDSGSSEGMSQE